MNAEGVGEDDPAPHAGAGALPLDRGAVSGVGARAITACVQDDIVCAIWIGEADESA
eukprot:CAMPEP_0182897436 /NCGR_PEP_ID=MMETSP0034_2-20130328/26889_1 /TAXON_ID=156128 /ORGANISM="Nephroselmis pyriformis, Strain CCMP717" /LENGTH=56 /DNA_ID=CAMNT_0025031357 /DNA_START=390 /DNA_END=556 /DNA_ORIENTATION=+